MHTEAARQFYLGVAGVRMWYAREPLPGAAPSPEYDFSEDNDETVAPELGVTASAVPAQTDPEQAARSRDKIAHLQSLMSAVEAPSSSARPPKSPKPVPQQTAVEGKAGSPEEAPVPVEEPARVSVHGPEAVPRLFIQAWEGDRFLLLAEMSEDASLSLQQTLATNILRSLGEFSSKRLDAIHWPLFNNLKVSLNRVEHLLEAISGSYGKGGDRQVIVLGNGADWIEDALGKAPAVQFSGSLAKLASEPQLKRELWQMIKPLAAL
ncbi:hypothetical protein [Marinobacter sp. S0848L]|uniref:hypothetical protein n=1 Tax=Marinobacter sp. S0848L TaxID=2926423 RepID=UPI001FF663E9|nr:hypothetical protein [Marinobacter sp. S0848L]MCK0106205.1 hypothetical protein [Marinobacter sp. S0848L]